MSAVPVALLSAGTHAVEMPRIGCGVGVLAAPEAAATVTSALDAGYRSIDTPAADDTETGVGEALAASGVPREEIFVAARLDDDRQGFDEAILAFEESAKRLRQHVLDLLLAHRPCPGRDRYVETWRALLHLRDEGRVRTVGVSDFGIPHLQRLMDETGEAPAVNQVELHPYRTQEPLRAFHAEHGIATEACAPLASGAVLADPTIEAIAREAGRSPAQVVLRWHVQGGHIAVPRSTDAAHLAENLDLDGFELSPEQVARIDALDPETTNQPARAGASASYPG